MNDDAIVVPEPTDVVIAAISHCLQAGDFRGAAFPEQVEAWMRSLAAEQRVTAERMIRDQL